MQVNRRNFLAGAMGAGAIGLNAAYAQQAKQAAAPMQELDKAAAAPVLEKLTALIAGTLPPAPALANTS